MFNIVCVCCVCVFVCVCLCVYVCVYVCACLYAVSMCNSFVSLTLIFWVWECNPVRSVGSERAV